MLLDLSDSGLNGIWFFVERDLGLRWVQGSVPRAGNDNDLTHTVGHSARLKGCLDVPRGFLSFVRDKGPTEFSAFQAPYLLLGVIVGQLGNREMSSFRLWGVLIRVCLHHLEEAFDVELGLTLRRLFRSVPHLFGLALHAHVLVPLALYHRPLGGGVPL